MTKPYIRFGDIVEANGKTIRENNMELKHSIPLGAIVEFDVDQDRGDDGIGFKGTARLYVVFHGRDCDGSPLYGMSDWPIARPSSEGYGEEYRRWKMMVNIDLHGYGEESLRDTGKRAERFYTVREFVDSLRGG